jgi:protease I
MAGLELSGLRVAILVENGFEQVEMEKPRAALHEAGAQTFLVSPSKDTVQGVNHDDPGDTFPVDVTMKDADPARFDALLIPGGVRSPDRLRTNRAAVLFTAAFFTAQKPIAVICHGPWILVESGVARGHRLTSWPSLKTDIINAGGDWADQPVVHDRLLVTSRKPDDIPKFNHAMIDLFASTARAVGASK